MVVLYVMFGGTFFLCLSQAMLITALPVILREFSINAGYGQILTTGYIFALGLISALSAALVYRFSTKRLFLVSLGSFLVGCVLCLVAQDFTTLVIGRFLQAGGAGISLPLIQNVALIVYPKEEYGKAMGLVGLIIGFAPAIGPVVSGPIIDYLGWRAIFLILLVIVGVCFVLALFLVRNMAHRREVHINIPSAVLYFIGCTCVMTAFTQLESFGPADPVVWGTFAVGVLFIVGYVRHDKRSRQPLLHLGCFRSRRFTIDTLFVIFGQASMMIASIMVPLFIQGVQGESATLSGLTIMPGAILLGILNPVTGRLYDRYGARPLAICGCVLILAGTIAFTFCTADTPFWLIILLYGLRILGISAVWMPMTADASVALPPGEAAQATAITTSLRQMISAVLSTVFVSIMALFTVDASGISVYGFSVSFWVLSALSSVMLMLALFGVKGRRRKSGRRREEPLSGDCAVETA